MLFNQGDTPSKVPMVLVKETAESGGDVPTAPRPAPAPPAACRTQTPDEHPLGCLPPRPCGCRTQLHASASISEENMVGNDVIHGLIS